MNKTEQIAYKWLQTQNVGGISFDRRGTPDFHTDHGSFEVKRVYGTDTITFSRDQRQKVIDSGAKVLIFRDGDEAPSVVLEASDLVPNIGSKTANVMKKGIRIHIFEDEGGPMIRVRADVRVKMAFDEWWIRYRKESGNPTASQGEALEALLREKGLISGVKGQVFA
jgi:hypothetical protein